MAVQVYTATHSAGRTLLPAIERQFISFKWGDHNIEDYDLLVVHENRFEKEMYAPFTDSTSFYDGIDGQSFWMSTSNPVNLRFSLSTDGMDSKTYEEFKSYFRPGIARRLILTEYPYRYAMARVSAAPTISMLPFEKTITRNNTSFRTTEYKGDIELNFILDDPYWYGTKNYFTAAEAVTEEAMKDIYESETPVIGSLSHGKCWLGGYKYCSTTSSDPVDGTNAPTLATAAHLTDNYVCNGGTAPALPITYLKMPLEIDGSTGKMGGAAIKQLAIGSDVYYLSYTPFMGAFNQAIDTVNDYRAAHTTTEDRVELKKLIREKVNQSSVRAKAVAVINDTTKPLVDFAANLKAALNILNTTFAILTLNAQTGMVTASYYQQNATAFLEEQAGIVLKGPLPKINEHGYSLVTTDFNVYYVRFNYTYTYR